MARLASVVLVLVLTAVRAGAQPALRLPHPADTETAYVLGTALAPYGDNVIAGGGDYGYDLTHVYEFDPTNGAIVRAIADPAPAGFTRFGDELAVGGGTIIVGAPGDYLGDTKRGRVDVFDATSGALLRTLTAPVPASYDEFGEAVALVGGVVAVGAPGRDDDGVNSGLVYLFDLATGALVDTLHSPAPQLCGRFGTAVAAVGGNLAVGAPIENCNPCGTPAVFLFDVATGNLLQTFDDPLGACEGFGGSVASLGANVLVSGIGVSLVPRVHLFDAATGALIRTFAAGGPGIAAFGATGVLAADYASGVTVRLFDAASGALLRTIQRPIAYGSGFGNAFLSSGDRIVVGHTGDDRGFSGGPVSPVGTVYVFCGGAAGCGPCQTCAPDGSCTTAPHPTCRGPADAGVSLLRITNSAEDARDKLKWKWQRTAEHLHHFVFGAPTDTQDQTLCLFDGTGTLVFRTTAPAGGVCRGRDCWREIGSPSQTYLYTDQDRTPEGVVRLVLDTAGPTRPLAKITALASGSLLNTAMPLPTTPLHLPLRAQFQVKDGECFEATYSSASRNENGRFAARSD